MDRNRLIKYVQSLNAGELIYQFPDNLLSVLGDPTNEATTLSQEKNVINHIILEAKAVQVVEKQLVEEYECFSDLADWSNEDDTLVLVDEHLLLNLGNQTEVEKLF